MFKHVSKLWFLIFSTCAQKSHFWSSCLESHLESAPSSSVLQATFLVLSKKKKLKRNCFILLPSWHRRKSSFPFLIWSSKQRGLHLYHSTLGPLSLTSWQQAPREDCPISVTKGVPKEFSIRKLAFSSITFLGSIGNIQAPGGLPPFVLKIQNLGRKEGGVII